MWRPGWDCSRNPHQRRFRPLGDVPLFEKILCIYELGDILAVESGYEEGCKRGAKFQSAYRITQSGHPGGVFCFPLNEKDVENVHQWSLSTTKAEHAVFRRLFRGSTIEK